MTGTVPEHMQNGKIIPIYKSKSKDDFATVDPYLYYQPYQKY